MSTRARVVAVAVLFLFSGIAIFLMPYLTVNNMKAAAESHDPATLSHYIDFPSVRESVKATASAKLAAATGIGTAPNNPFANLGSAMAGAFVDRMVDALITPESIAMMMTGRVPDDAQKKEDAATIAADLETSQGYEDPNQFAVSVKKKGTLNPPITFVLARDRLVFWKLVAVRLP